MITNLHYYAYFLCRRPGQSKLTTDVTFHSIFPNFSVLTSSQRNEKDRVTIQSGVERGITLGTPIGLFVPNDDMRPADYGGMILVYFRDLHRHLLMIFVDMSQIPRPSHADFTYQIKYNVRASSGGGRASARETIGMIEYYTRALSACR